MSRIRSGVHGCPTFLSPSQKLAVAEGWTIYNFAWSTGNPYVGATKPSCWAQPETEAFLRYAAASNGKVGVSLHEYANSLDITNEWPWRTSHIVIVPCFVVDL
eukprot:m.3267 g.3267  ORF g.3267 m.3267 type:complete len:103 (-) comp659_c0_seq1:132-440(-)